MQQKFERTIKDDEQEKWYELHLHNLINWEETRQHYDYFSNECGVMTFVGASENVKGGDKRRA